MIGKRFEQLDALRFVAVFAVLLAHWPIFGINGKVQFHLGAAGVNLFFVISGFLITLGLIRSAETRQRTPYVLRNFYIRRFLRIFPPYYLMLLLLWFFNHRKVADGMVWYVSYLTNFYCIKIEDWSNMSHLWSLAIEEQFYLVWPFAILLLPCRFIPVSALLSIILSVALKIYWSINGASFWVIYMHPLAAIDAFALGALLSWGYNFHQQNVLLLLQNRIITAVVFLQLLAFWGFHDYLGQFGSVFYRFSEGLVFTWITGIVIFGVKGILGKALSFRPILYIGKISYGVYLFHVLVPGMLLGLTFPAHETFLRFCLYLAVTIALAALSWHYYEKRILKIKKRFE